VVCVLLLLSRAHGPTVLIEIKGQRMQGAHPVTSYWELAARGFSLQSAIANRSQKKAKAKVMAAYGVASCCSS
jgi:hypothetical protein